MALAVPTSCALGQNATPLLSGTISTFAGSKDPNASQAFDGVLANDSQILQPYFTALDKNGNLYFSYIAGNSVGVSVVYGGNKVPPLLALRVPSPQKGFQYRVVGTLSPTLSDPVCTPPSPCGDGGPALAPSGSTNPLITPFGLAVDSAGNLYIADEVEQSIRKVNATDGTISTIAGDPMHLQNGYSGDGGPAASAVLSYPNAVRLDSSGNIYIADAGNYLIRRIDGSGAITSVAGNVAAAAAANGSGSFPPSCSASVDSCGEGGAPLNATLGYVFGMSFDASGNLFLAESDIEVVREIDFASNSPIIHTVAGTLRTPCAPGATPPYCGDTGLATAAQLNGLSDVLADAAGNVVISDTLDNAVRLVTASDGKIQTLAGQISATGNYGGDGGPATSALLNSPYGLTLDPAGNLYIVDGSNYLIREVSPLPAYTITFPPPSSATYGTAPIPLNATVNETGQPVASYKVLSGPGRISGATLVVTGAGTVTVEADQPGDSGHTAAAPISQSVTIASAPLIVQADDISFIFGSASQLPPLTYTLKGLVNGDGAGAVSGTPILTTTATASSDAGKYPINLNLNGMTSVNYALTAGNGTLTIVGNKTQSITFGPLPNVTYGVATFSLDATASSGLPVTFSVSGPAKLLGAKLTVQGTGIVVVTATQDGNTNYAPASPVVQQFTVLPATLSITADAASRTFGQPNPAFTYTPSGFVNGDTAAVLSGAPVISSSADKSAVPGNYPIIIAQGTLYATNYAIAPINGAPGEVLTVTPAAQAITFGDVRDTAYTQSETIVATASSGLPLQYTATGPVKINAAQDGSSVLVIPTDIGPVTVTATQAGNQDYSAAPPATVSFNVVKAKADILVQNATRPFGAANPAFQYQIRLFPGDQGADPIAPPYFTGTPDITTTANESSPPGTYPIVATQGTLTAQHYYFAFDSGTLTVTSAASYIITTTPSSLIVPRGSTRQLTITLSPVNNYSGSVTLGCGGLPAGVICSFSPASLTIPPPDPGSSSAQPVQGTLTITADGSPASARSNDMSGRSRPFFAGFFFLPGLLGGLLLWRGRKRFLKNVRARNALVFAVLFGIVSAVAACGGGSSLKGNQASPGTTVIQVTGSGTASAGASDLNQSVSLSLTVQ